MGRKGSPPRVDIMEKAKQKRTASEALAQARKKEELERQRMSAALAQEKQQSMVIKLQSGFRGFAARKEIWTIKNSGRPLTDRDMLKGLGSSPSPQQRASELKPLSCK